MSYAAISMRGWLLGIVRRCLLAILGVTILASTIVRSAGGSILRTPGGKLATACGGCPKRCFVKWYTYYGCDGWATPVPDGKVCLVEPVDSSWQALDTDCRQYYKLVPSTTCCTADADCSAATTATPAVPSFTPDCTPCANCCPPVRSITISSATGGYCDAFSGTYIPTYYPDCGFVGGPCCYKVAFSTTCGGFACEILIQLTDNGLGGFDISVRISSLRPDDHLFAHEWEGSTTACPPSTVLLLNLDTDPDPDCPGDITITFA